MTDYLDFYNEKKFCPHCHQYVPYLASLNRSFCSLCGQPVNLFSKDDWQKFRRNNSKTTVKKTTFIVSKKNRAPEDEH